MKFLIAFTLLAVAANIIVAVDDIQPVHESLDDEATRQKKSYGAVASYGAPTYSAPSHGYSAPSHGYAAPSHGYAAPSHGYGAPSHGYAAPSHGYGAPSHGYGAPSHGYAAPSHGYAAPSHGYAAPSYGYGAPAYGVSSYSLGAPNPMFGAKEKDEPAKPEAREHAASELDIVAAIPEEAYYDIEATREKKSVYGGSHGYAAPVQALHPGPATSYSYASHAPTVPCAKNVLVSCSPSVAPVPCAAPSYGHSSYGSHGSILGASKAY